MSPDKEFIFIKLGGAAITFKDTPLKANTEVLKRMAKELATVQNDYKMLIGHGGGSFPHPVAKEHRVQEGIETCGAKGFYETQRAARMINSITMEHLLEQDLPVIPIQTSACTVMSNGEISEIYTKSIMEILRYGLIPVIYGDVVADLKKGCAIASTEMIFKYLAAKLKPSRIIIGTDVDGVFTKDPKSGEGELVPLISKKNHREVVASLGGSEPVVPDVTGSMAHKVEELYKISKMNIEVQIINLMKPGYLERAVRGEKVGTIIKVE